MGSGAPGNRSKSNVLNLSIVDQLSSLGNAVGLLQKKEKECCFTVLKQYLELAEKSEATDDFESSLKTITRERMYVTMFTLGKWIL